MPSSLQEVVERRHGRHAGSTRTGDRGQRAPQASPRRRWGRRDGHGRAGTRAGRLCRLRRLLGRLGRDAARDPVARRRRRRAARHRAAVHRRGRAGVDARGRDARRPLGRPGAAGDARGLRGGGACCPGLATSTASLCAALLVLGATSGAVDVAINAEGVRTEAATGRPVLSLAHGTFSACVVAGSLAAGALRAAGRRARSSCSSSSASSWPPTAAVLLRAPAAAGARAPARRIAAPAPAPARRSSAGCARWPSSSRTPGRAGARCTSSPTSAPRPRLGALAPALFAGAAALSRLGGHGARRARERADAAARRRGAGRRGDAARRPGDERRRSRWPASSSPAPGSPSAPPCSSRSPAAAPTRRVRGAAVSIVTTIAYLGFLVGPAAVGLLANATALRTSLAAVAGVARGAGDPGARERPALGLDSTGRQPPDRCGGAAGWPTRSCG